MRKQTTVAGAETEFFDRVWYDRHQQGIDKGRFVSTPEDIIDGALEAARRVEEKYGAENLGPYSDFEWGMICGKLSALRWVMGSDWDTPDPE